ncbi:MAG: 1,4-alpha-glucan branching protein GlgB [Synergistaceae bacterium]|nr:1,4-alpha-glucan branching protein GlgB [Synergistaceae bacterium]
MENNILYGPTLASEQDIYLFREGTHRRIYDFLGAHITEHDGKRGVLFALWAPNARSVSVMGDFNAWNGESCPLAPRWDSSGIWEGFVPSAKAGCRYKYAVTTQEGARLEKSDPLAFFCEMPPATASVICEAPSYQWKDSQWMAERAKKNALDAPQLIYELHAGSWRRGEDNAPLGWLGLAEELPPYLQSNGFTHVEFMPVMEHPFYGSWGYQTTGYYAPTSRYGSPEQFMALIDALHAAGIGVILDWVPSHFPMDPHGLSRFDGTALYEHEDPRQGFHPDWKSAIFNYGRSEVRSFLISSASFWLDRYHADGLRVDAVASMLYLDYSRRDGEWLPNRYGGKENCEAIDFLKELNCSLYEDFPGIMTAAEESTSWPMVTKPVWLGGLGFGYKWNMGWMNDFLSYISSDPIYRKYCHDRLTFGMWYAYAENFVLPFSHDEVVYGKCSLLEKMPGDEWQKAANLRLALGWFFCHPGKKLIFMGGEFGQSREWNHDQSLDWHQLNEPRHAGIARWFADLGAYYRSRPQLWKLDCSDKGFSWIDCSDRDAGVVSFIRRDDNGRQLVLAANFTPVTRSGYRVGLSSGGRWREALNSDALIYGGSGVGNLGSVQAEEKGFHSRPYSAELTLPPLACLLLEPEKDPKKPAGKEEK